MAYKKFGNRNALLVAGASCAGYRLSPGECSDAAPEGFIWSLQ